MQSRRDRPGRARAGARLFAVLAVPLALGACATVEHQSVRPDESKQVIGPAVRDNRTPLELAYRCYGQRLRAASPRPLSIAVGSINDYTGKTSDLEGATVTQGGSLMVFSALAKLGKAVLVHDRFDTRVTELELAYVDKRRLGDGRSRQVDGRQVPWLPYFGGTIAPSTYFIVGGITEVNYNIRSGGAEFRVGQTGPKARTYTLSIAADLRLVNTSSLVVESAVSVQKQLVGYEVGFETFRFLDIAGGNELFDVNIGAKSQEPLQLGVRATLEAGVLELLSDLTGVAHEPCLPEVWRLPTDEALQAASVDERPAAAEAPEGARAGADAAPASAPAAPAVPAAAGGATAPETPAGSPVNAPEPAPPQAAASPPTGVVVAGDPSPGSPVAPGGVREAISAAASVALPASAAVSEAAAIPSAAAAAAIASTSAPSAAPPAEAAADASADVPASVPAAVSHPAVAPADGALDSVRQVRFGIHEGFTRVVVALDRPALFRAAAAGQEVRIELEGVRLDFEPELSSRALRLFDAMSVARSERGVELRLVGREPLSLLRTFVLAPKGDDLLYRVVVDVTTSRSEMAAVDASGRAAQGVVIEAGGLGPARQDGVEPVGAPAVAASAQGQSESSRSEPAEAERPAAATESPGVVQGAPRIRLF